MHRKFNMCGKYNGLNTKDYGPEAAVLNLEQLAVNNRNFRTALWTGENLQVTLMSLRPGECIGLEKHSNLDQLLVIEQGYALVQMGTSKNNLDIKARASKGYAVFVPQCTYHNIINIGNIPLKLYSVYAPPQHPRGIVQQNKVDAVTDEY